MPPEGVPVSPKKLGVNLFVACSQCSARILSDLQQAEKNDGKFPEDLYSSKVEQPIASGYQALSLKYATKMGSHSLRPRSTFQLSELYHLILWTQGIQGDGGELATVHSQTPPLQPSFSEASCAAKMLYLCFFVLYLFGVLSLCQLKLHVKNRFDLVWRLLFTFFMLIG